MFKHAFLLMAAALARAPKDSRTVKIKTADGPVHVPRALLRFRARWRFKLNAKRVPGGDKQERQRRLRQIGGGRITAPIYSSLNPRVLA
jgi:hypothetical protein